MAAAEEELKTVFISYSWDDEDHKSWVLNLADKLAKDGGVFAILDRYDLKASKSMTYFMEKSVQEADKVLLIMTPNYKLKADNRIGGVGYEYSMISQEFYEKLENEKFIPVLRKGNYLESSPKFIKGVLSHDMTNDAKFESDFTELLRLIYEEPEIVRPVRGKKPIFPSRITHKDNSLINEIIDMKKCEMNTYAKWTFSIKLNSLNDLDNSELFKEINSNLIENKQGYFDPEILSPFRKTSHVPDINYEIGPKTYFASNHFVAEKARISNGMIRYEFAEYGNQEFWNLYLVKPLITFFYMLAILYRVHNQLKREVSLEVAINFVCDRRALLYQPYSPFKYAEAFNMQLMGVPDSEASLTSKLKNFSKDSMFSLFEKIYSIFVAENPKSQNPFILLDRVDFDKVMDIYFV